MAKYNGNPFDWWLRSPDLPGNANVCGITQSGSFIGYNLGSFPIGVRPALVCPPDLIVDDDNNILAAAYPTPPASITVPTSPVPSSAAIAVSWSSVSGAESYQLQRSANGGSWQTVYTGPETSYSDVARNWTQVQYRVASVTMGITSGYATSTTVTILPYVVESFTTPSQVMQGQTIPLSWTASAAANTYILQRNVNGGGWTQIYSGGNTSYTDTPQSNWTTVQYRVQAGANGSYGAYATSASIPVISASALVISGTDGDLGTLTSDVPFPATPATPSPWSATSTASWWPPPLWNPALPIPSPSWTSRPALGPLKSLPRSRRPEGRSVRPVIGHIPKLPSHSRRPAVWRS